MALILNGLFDQSGELIGAFHSGYSEFIEAIKYLIKDTELENEVQFKEFQGVLDLHKEDYSDDPKDWTNWFRAEYTDGSFEELACHNIKQAFETAEDMQFNTHFETNNPDLRMLKAVYAIEESELKSPRI